MVEWDLILTNHDDDADDGDDDADERDPWLEAE